MSQASWLTVVVVVQVYKIGSVLTTGLLSGLVYLITSTQALIASQVHTGHGRGPVLAN